MRFITSTCLTLCRKHNSNVFLLRQLCESGQNKNISRWKVPCCWCSCGQKQPFQIFCKKGVLKNFARINGKTSMLKSLFNKVKVDNFIKKVLQHMFFSFEFCKTFKNIFFKEHVRTIDYFCVGCIFWKYFFLDNYWHVSHYKSLMFHDGDPYHIETSPLICLDWFLHDMDLRHERVKLLKGPFVFAQANMKFYSCI